MIVCALVLFAFAWRLHGLELESLWRDEVDALAFALGDLQRLLAMFAQPGQNGPLYFLSLRWWLQASGASEFALRYPSLLLGMLTIPLTWQIGRRLLPGPATTCQATPAGGLREGWRSPWQILTGDAALLAAAFLAVNPYQLWYSQEGKMYTATTLLVLLTAWLWLKGVNGQSGPLRWLGLAAVLVAGFYVHLLLVLVLPLLAVWSVITVRRNRSEAIASLLILLVVLALLTVRASWLWQVVSSPTPGTGRLFMPLRPLLQATLRYQFNGVLPPARGRIWLIPMIVLAAAGLFYGWRLARVDGGQKAPTFSVREGQLLVAAWILLPPFGLYLLSLLQPLFQPRYLIWIAPALMMALALGVQLLQPHRSPARSRLATLLVLFILGHGLMAGWEQKRVALKSDLRGAVQTIVQRREPEDLLIFQIPHLEYAYRYYSGKRQANPFAGSDGRLGRWAGGLWTNNDLDEAEAMRGVDAEMQRLTRGADEIWVMRSEAEMWDARDLMDRWLREHGRRVEVIEFQGVQVVHYRFRSEHPAGIVSPGE